MLNPESISALRTLVDGTKIFLVVSHMRPDGDAYGSSLGLALSLREMGKQVQVVNADGLAAAFQFLPGSGELASTTATPPPKECAIIAVDCADQKRLGPAFDQWQRLPDVNIDHHVSNPGYATINLIDPHSPATAEVLYEIMAELGWPVTPSVASNLYVGIMTDTGSFRYRQTTARTFAIAAKLVEAGADPTDLSESCFQSFRSERLLLVREVLNTMRFANHNRIAWFHLDPAIYSRTGAGPDETEGLLEYLQAVKTVEAAFLIEGLPDGLTRASLRSRGKVDVQKICATLGGGGHRLASGLRTKLDPTALEKKLLELIAEQLPE